MSGNYRISDGGPTIVSYNGEPTDTLISNNGAFPAWLNTTPGTYNAVGFMLPAGATKEWPARAPLYVQCDPGNTTTVSVSENTGVLYAPSPQNTPNIVFQNISATCIDAAPPINGIGDLWTFYVGPAVSRTNYLDVTNYNSLILNIRESGLNGAAHQTRSVTVSWYVLDSSGTYRQTYTQLLRHYTINTPSSDPTVAPPQIQAHLPVRGTYVQIEVDSMSAVATPGTNYYDVTIIGDYRTISYPIIRNSAYYWWAQENQIIGPNCFTADLSLDNHLSGSVSVPGAGSRAYSFSSLNGIAHMFGRITAGAGITTASRVEISDRFTGNEIAATEFNTTTTGVINFSQQIVLPNNPCVATFFNNVATAATMFLAIKWERF